MPGKQVVVLVHGWSVRSTDTYGELPARLESEAAAQGLDIDVRQIWLGQYVSFHDEVRLEDISRAFQAAIRETIGAHIDQGGRFACITHSTGGPVVRDWWHRFYRPTEDKDACPLSHLIMLAPANFGSALAQLGAARVSRIKAWVDTLRAGDAVQPGAGVLEWLELGSAGSWALNTDWIRLADPTTLPAPVYSFVLTGQAIDRALYDHLNSYTDEAGSDGVVRTAAANLNTQHVLLRQQAPLDGETSAELVVDEANSRVSHRCAFALIPGRSHSGEKMGILRSILDDGAAHPTVEAIVKCLKVTSRAAYLGLCDDFDAANRVLRKAERVEVSKKLLGEDTFFLHDTHAMVIFRLRDHQGHVLTDYDLLLTGDNGDPDLLPRRFLVDRQRNNHDPGTLTYYFNYDVMRGFDESTMHGSRKLRAPMSPAKELGLEVIARPDSGFVHFIKARLLAQPELLAAFIKPDQTTLVDIELRRIVHKNTFALTLNRDHEDFTGVRPGDPIRNA